MDNTLIIIAFLSFSVVAFLYASVGHGGASGYLAIMSLLSFPISSIKPISLTLNIIVSLIGAYNYIKAGYFDKRVFLAFAVTSIPLAFIGGMITLDPYWFKIFTGCFLVISALLLLAKSYFVTTENSKNVNIPVALVIGAMIGLLSGLLGVGGGIFLSPIIILLGWTTVRNASGISALFILCNSILGLAGHYVAFKGIHATILYWVVAVGIGGYAGAYYGSKKFNNSMIIIFLFVVLLSAGLKFILMP
jgi:uncharacterized membrane protein YfcA